MAASSCTHDAHDAHDAHSRPDFKQIHYRGTLTAFSREETTKLVFNFLATLSDVPLMTVTITENDVVLRLREGKELQAKLHNKTRDACLDKGHKTKYWVSFDAGSGVIRYGKYFPNKQLTLLEAFLKSQAAPDGKTSIAWGTHDLSGLRNINIACVMHNTSKGPIAPLKSTLLSLPVLGCDIPPIITPLDELTASMIDDANYTVASSLHPACQDLYALVASVKVSLNDTDFPDFSDAIQHSIQTEGHFLYNVLRQKAAKGSHDLVASAEEIKAVTPEQLRAQYLRITLGCHRGNSPGVPFVLEIWPAGHHSSIHDHDGACAVIKVLHGEIKCQWYKSLEPARKMGAREATFQEGQITWMDPDHYQIHRLHNRSAKVCCTLQCYQYSSIDGSEPDHDGGFHYVDRVGRILTFEPNSDMSYKDFRAVLKEEWTRHVEDSKEAGIIVSAHVATTEWTTRSIKITCVSDKL